MTFTQIFDTPAAPEVPTADVEAPTAPSDGDPPGPTPAEVAATARDRARRFLVRAALVGALVVTVVFGFEAGVTRIWYDAHQRQLGSDFAVGRSKLAPGQAAALLQIPTIGLNLTVVEGDTTEQLRIGPGHRPGTPLPGQRGNSLIFGHRHGWGAPFADLDQLHPNDPHPYIVAKIRGPEPTVFKIVTVKHVAADDTSFFGKSTDHRITLVTGDGGDFSSNRLVVVAVSGAKGKLRPAKGVAADADNGSAILNPLVGLMLVSFGVAWTAFVYLRRRYRALATAAVVVPFLLAGGLALLLAADRVLPPLR